MFWTPKNHHLGDVTIIRVGEEYHLFTEQTPLGAEERFAGARTVGHALSRDLLHWEELPPAIGCGPRGAFDEYTIYHMDVFLHDGKWYMYYTGLDRPGAGQQQAIGLATSLDGIRWEKHPANPILRADPRYYEQAIPREATYQEKDFGRLWFRDPCVIRDSRTGLFGMIVIARDLAQHPDVRGCLAWATSTDLIRWEAHPPIFSPGRFHTIETPSIFEQRGRHYIIYMTHSSWGPPVMATDPYQTAGDFYAISESGWTGPYIQPEDEVVVAAHGQMRMGAARTVDGPRGERYLYGWLDMRPSEDDSQLSLTHPRVLPPPKRVRFSDDGKLMVEYWEKIESFYNSGALEVRSISAPSERWRIEPCSIIGKDLGQRTIALFTGEHANAIFSTRIRFVRGERAGLVLRAEAIGTQGWQVVADRRFGRVEFGTLQGGGFIDARRWPPKQELELKVVTCGESVEIYADNRLMIHQVRYREKRGKIGFLVERGEAIFSNWQLLA